MNCLRGCNFMKKLLCLLISAVFVFALSACGKGGSGSGDGVTAVSGTDINTDVNAVSGSDLDLPDSKDKDGYLKTLEIGGIPVVRDGVLTGLGFSGANYSKGVITLDNSALEGITITFQGDLTVEITGENSITNANGEAAFRSIGDGISGLTFRGDGKLNITAGNEKDSAVMCSGELTVEGGSLDIVGNPVAVVCSGDIIFAEGFGFAEGSADDHVIIGALA